VALPEKVIRNRLLYTTSIIWYQSQGSDV